MVIRLNDDNKINSSSFELKVRAGLPFSIWSITLFTNSIFFCAILSPDLDILIFFSLKFSKVSRSFICSSISIVSLSLIGSTDPSTWTTLSSSKQRITCIIAFVSRILAKNLFPKPSPLLAPLTSPAISTISTVVGTIFWGLTNFEILSNLLSGTEITPTFGSIVQNGKFSDWALAFERQLNNEDFPTFGRPTIPHFKAIIYNLDLQY